MPEMFQKDAWCLPPAEVSEHPKLGVEGGEGGREENRTQAWSSRCDSVPPFLFWASICLALKAWLLDPQAWHSWLLENKESVEVLESVVRVEACPAPCWMEDSL